MSTEEVLARWQADVAQLASVRMNGVWVEITLPFSTLTSKFIRVFVQANDDGTYLLSDLCDLSNDTYEVGEERRAFYAAIDLTERKVSDGGCYCQSGAVFCRVPQAELLTARLFDLAQLLQLVVNLAVLAGHRGPVCENALVVTQITRR